MFVNNVCHSGISGLRKINSVHIDISKQVAKLLQGKDIDIYFLTFFLVYYLIVG